MKKSILIIVLLLLVIVRNMDAQSGVCDYGDFETTGFESLYTFRSDSDVVFSCNTLTNSLSQISPVFTTYDNFNDPVSLVTNGNEPLLSSSGVDIQRVYQGNYSIKLNSSGSPTKELTSMSISIFPTNTVVSFHYLLLAQNPGVAPADRPKFIARLSYSGTVISQLCMEVDNSTPGFESTGITTSDFLYKNWSCENFIIDDSYIDQELILEFIVADDYKGLGITTVYIDDICDVFCCEDCLNGLGDVNNSVDNKEAETCIIADNSISGGSEAIYHAGYEVVFLPDFEALSGTKDRFYIQECSGEFALRGINSQKSLKTNQINELSVYPNPMDNLLNIQLNGITISTLEMYTMDGKKILTRKIYGKEDFNVDTSDFTKGIYLLKIITVNGIIKTYKLLKK